MVLGPDGEIYNVLRFNSMPLLGNKAVVLQYTDTSNALE